MVGVPQDKEELINRYSIYINEELKEEYHRLQNYVQAWSTSRELVDITIDQIIKKGQEIEASKAASTEDKPRKGGKGNEVS